MGSPCRVPLSSLKNFKVFSLLMTQKRFLWWWWAIYVCRFLQVSHPSSMVWLLIFVYICYCSLQVPYCSGRELHGRMLLYPVAIYTVPLLGQRLQIGARTFLLGLVTCHPPGCSLPLAPCTAHVADVRWSLWSIDLGLACSMWEST